MGKAVVDLKNGGVENETPATDNQGTPAENNGSNLPATNPPAKKGFFGWFKGKGAVAKTAIVTVAAAAAVAVGYGVKVVVELLLSGDDDENCSDPAETEAPTEE